MTLVTDYLLVDVVLAALPLMGFVYWYFTNIYYYWDKRNVVNTKTSSIIRVLLGNVSQAEVSLELYNQFPHEKYSGFIQLRTPGLVIKDPVLINKILVKDFIYFQDRGTPMFKNDVLTENLFNLKGPTWRALRYKLTPTFSTSKLRGMFEQISRCGDSMMEKIEELLKNNNEIESKSFIFVFTLDIIARCAFGLQIKPDSPEFHTFKSSVENLFTISTLTMFKYIVLIVCPKLAEVLNLKLFSDKTTEYFLNMTSSNAKHRKENNISRNDYFQLLLSLKEQEDNGQEPFVPSDTVEDAVIDQMKYAEQSGSSASTHNMKGKLNLLQQVK